MNKIEMTEKEKLKNQVQAQKAVIKSLTSKMHMTDAAILSLIETSNMNHKVEELFRMILKTNKGALEQADLVLGEP